MVQSDFVTARRSPARRHAHGPGPIKVAVEGPGDEKSRLIDALRRRYGRRRAVVASPAGAMEVNDPAIDLVLVEAGADDEASSFGPDMVDATIVVGTGGEGNVEPSRIERDASGRPTAFIDLATGKGIDVVMAWLQHELRLEPWRA